MVPRQLILIVLTVLLVSARGSSEIDTTTNDNSLRMSFSRTSIELVEVGGHTTLNFQDANFTLRTSAYSLPLLAVRYAINGNYSNIELVILEETKESRPLKLPLLGNGITNESSSDVLVQYPSDGLNVQNAGPVFLSDCGNFRSHMLATILYVPISYNEQKHELSISTMVSFQFTGEVESGARVVIPSSDIQEHEQLEVNDSLDINIVVPNSTSLGSRWVASPVDTVKYLIITSPAMKSTFQTLANRKSSQGSKARVLSLVDVALEFPDTSFRGFPYQLRDCIRHYYGYHETDWVLLAGDLSVIPAVYITPRDSIDNVFHGRILTDQYYACLENDWNEDGDEFFGEVDFYGDRVDYTPEVYIGRIPVTTSAQATAYINKLIAWENGSLSGNCQKRLLQLGSEILNSNDGRDFSEGLGSKFPPLYARATLYESDDDVVIDSMNAGFGIIINFSHSQNTGNFLTQFSNRLAIDYSEMDGLTNSMCPSFFINSTCWNNMIDSTNSIATHFMVNRFGGGIGYVGSTSIEYPIVSKDFYNDFVFEIFENGNSEVGKALALAKMNYIPRISWLNNIERNLNFSMMLLGDPQLKLYTGTPQALDIDAPDWLPWGLGPQQFYISVTSNGVPVPNTLVNVTYGTSINVNDTTDENGVAHFSGVSVPDSSEGEATITATKGNFYRSQTIMRLTHCGIAGDVDDNCTVAVSDPVYINNYIFSSGPAPEVPNRADPNATGSINISDAVYLINYIFAGGPAPLPGTVEVPAGGKVAYHNGDPNDFESIPNGLEVTNEISVTVEKADSRSRNIILNSTRTIYGLSITLKAAPSAKVNVVSLLNGDEAADLYWSQTGSLVKIGIVDVNGVKFFMPGSRPILKITGDFEIAYVLAADRGENASTITLRPAFTNPEKAPSEFSFEPNFPNPFNPSTSLSFSLPRASEVTLEIFNVLGQKVRTIVNEVLPAGRHSVWWDGTDQDGRGVSSGIYFARFSAGDFQASRKMLIVK